MEFNVTLTLVGLNMSAIKHDDNQQGNQNDGMALMFATSNLTHLSTEWLHLSGPFPHPMNPDAVILLITVRAPRFRFESQDSMMQRFSSYNNAFIDLQRYNRYLDNYAALFNAQLVSQVDITEVFVSGVAFVGNFMQDNYPTFSPAMGPSGPPRK
jgi:hypothetical protein